MNRKTTCPKALGLWVSVLFIYAPNFIANIWMVLVSIYQRVLAIPKTLPFITKSFMPAHFTQYSACICDLIITF